MSKLLKVLILEDNENDALLLQRELQRGGYELEQIVTDTAAGLTAALKEREWDIILSDYAMSGFDGPAALRIVQQLGLDIPFIIVSGTVGEDTAVESMKAGAADFFTKDKLIRLIPAVEREVRDARERHKRREAEAKLHSSEERYRTLFDLSLNAVYIHDLEGKFIDANSAALSLLGYDREDIIGLSFESLLLPDYVDTAMAVLRETIDLGYQREASEFKLRRKDGRIIDIETRSSTIYRNNRPYAIQGIAHDITDRNRIHAEERARRRFAETLHGIVSALLSGALDLDTMLQHIVDYASDMIPCDAATFMRVHNGTARVVFCKGFAAQDIPTILSTEFSIEHTRSLREMAANRRVTVIADTQAYADWRIHAVPELERIQSAMGSPIFVGDELFGFINLDSHAANHFTPEHADRLKILTDQAVVAIHNAELYEQLQQSERFARATVDALSAHIAILDASGQIISINQAWQDFARENAASPAVIHTFEDANYLAVCDEATGEGREEAHRVAAGIRAVIAGEADSFELEYTCHAPTVQRWFVVRVTRFRGPGPVRVVVAHENITARKVAEISQARYAERLELLHDIDRAILRADQPQAIAHAAISRLQRLMQCHSVSVTTFDFERDKYMVLASTATVPAALQTGSWHTIEDTRVIEVLARNELHTAQDLRKIATPSTTDTALLQAGIRSYARVPLISAGRLIGSINFRAEHPGIEFSDKLNIAQEVAAQLAIAIENARLLDIEQRRNVELTAIHNASLQLTGTLDIEAVLDTILDYAILLARADNAHIFLYEHDTLRFGAAQWDGRKQLKPLAEPRPEGLAYTVARSGQRKAYPDISQHPAYNDGNWHGALIGLPLQFAGEIKGVMNLAFARVRHFDEHELRVLELLADQAAIAIHNARLYQQIQSHADDLEQRVQERTYQLERSKLRVEAILNNTSDWIVLADEKGHIQQTNQGFNREFGYQPDEQFGQSLAILAADHSIPDLSVAMADVIAERVHRRLEISARRKDHSTLPVDALIAWFDGDDGGIVCSLRDMTSQKQVEAELREALEKEKELNELKTNFTSIVSHEFRTPLAVILSSVGILLRYWDRLEPERREAKLQIISQQVGRLTRLIDAVLTISRSETKGFDFKPRPTDLLALCQNIIEEIQVGYTKDVPIDFAHRGDCQSVLIDEYLFTHILQNLASNGVKYSTEGSTVQVSLVCTEAEVTLRVADQGIGIPQEHQSRLFESFQRAANVGQIEGTGIGLVIVKRAVEAHGGQIEFESDEGVGTTFTIRLPIQASLNVIEKG